MYDFCFTYPYATILALGGIFGFVFKGSFPSLLGGLGSAAILAACAQVSLNAYHKGKLSKTSTAVSLMVSLLLAGMMGVRWRRVGKFMPAGMVSLLSFIMVLFYMWNLLYVREPIIKQRSHDS